MAFPTTSVRDNFDRTDASTWGTNWSAYWGNEDGHIYSNTASSSASNDTSWRGRYYNVATYGPNSENYVTITVSGVQNTELGVRHPLSNIGTTPDGYVLSINQGGDGTHRIQRIDDGTGTTLGASISQAVDSGDKIGFEVTGTSVVTLKAYRCPSGGSWAQMGTDRTDNPGTYQSAGYLSLSSSGDATVRWQLDDWGGGTVSEGASVSVAGTLAISGTLSKVNQKLFAGTLATAGVLVKALSRFFTGVLDIVGSLSVVTGITLTATQDGTHIDLTWS